MGRLGLFVWDADLVDGLTRVLGTETIEAVVAAKGDLVSFRRFRKQPPPRGRFVHVQLHGFLHTRGGRQLWYADELAEAVAPERVPCPLTGALVTDDRG